MSFYSSTANGAPKTVSVSSFELIEKAAQETLCCSSCSASLYNRTDTLLWESMEFCSDKCLSMYMRIEPIISIIKFIFLLAGTYVKVIGSHCNTCNSQVGELNLGKLCVRFGTVVRQFCTSDCLEKFKSSHRLCAQCQVNMQDKEKVTCNNIKGNFMNNVKLIRFKSRFIVLQLARSSHADSLIKKNFLGNEYVLCVTK